MRLVEFLNEAKFRKPTVMFHGTLPQFARSIIKQGVVPDPQQKVWAQDPDASIYSMSRKSLPGSYWTSNLMTALSSSTTARNRLGKGDEGQLIIVAQIQEQSAFADEDSLNSMIMHALSEMYAQYFGHGIVSDFVPKYAALQYWMGDDTQEGMTKTYAKLLHGYLAQDPEKQPINYELMKAMLEALMLRGMAHEKKDNPKFSNSTLTAWEQSPKTPEIPSVGDIEGVALAVREKLTRSYTKTATAGGGGALGHTLRMTLPVAFRGANKILAIVEHPADYNAPVILYYGKLPDAYFQEYQRSVGKFKGAVNTRGQMVIQPDEKKKVAASMGSY